MSADPILQAFARLAARQPDRVVVTSTRRQATVADLEAAARAVGERLSRERLGSGDLVGLAVPNGPAFLAGVLGLRIAGLVPVLLDTASPEATRTDILAALGGAGVLAAPSGWAAASASWSFAVAAPERSRHRAPDLGAVKLTSGSTGAPRGIGVTAEALAADDRQLTAVMGLGPDDRMVAALPLSHSYGFASLALPALTRGARLLIPEERSPLAPVAAAVAGEATFFPTVPAFLGAYARLAEPPPLPSSLRLVISAGAPLPAETSAAFRERTGLAVHSFYGASECGGIAYDREGGAAERGTVGEPVPGVRVGLDPESGRLEVRSQAVAERYLPEPCSDLAGGRFLTGDLADLSGPEVTLIGRADDLIVVKGKKVNPREVETVLRELPGVDDVAVLGVQAPGASGGQVRAVLACAPGALGYDEVAAFCRTRLPEHKVPRSLVLVRELPRTARGKLDRAALLGLASER